MNYEEVERAWEEVSKEMSILARILQCKNKIKSCQRRIERLNTSMSDPDKKPIYEALLIKEKETLKGYEDQEKTLEDKYKSLTRRRS